MPNDALASFKKLQTAGIAVLVVGLVLLAIGFTGARQAALQSYLFAWILWMSITLGCYGLTLVHHMIKGNWAKPILRLLEAGGGPINLIMMAGLFLPIAVFMSDLYPWANSTFHWGAYDWFKRVYLNQGFFYARFLIYFLIWIGFASILRKSSHAQDESGDGRETDRRSNIAAPGVVVYVLTVTFAFTDWVMSLDPHWFSTIYGFWFVICQGLGAMSIVTIFVTSLKDKKPYSDVLTPVVTRDLGNVLLAFTMFWGYFSLSQFLIIYSGNLPEEIIYFLRRMEGVWLAIGTILVCCQFFAPFLFLLSGNTKRNPNLLRAVAILILTMRVLDHFWTTLPYFQAYGHAAPFSSYWVAIPAFLAVGGAWITALTVMVAKAPLLPRHEFVPHEVLEHA